ncbi:MAG: DUF433 domain-containing protein [Candidatus Magasanikbacteria bacterium]|nr:DUF433 domain-containing protein [Candidatus Magasanikbacteria bacterium]
MHKADQLIKLIEINPKKLGGKPVIKGTRIAVEQILRLLAAGVPAEEIRQDFPQLSQEQILAAVTYASKLMEDFHVYPREYLTQIKLQPA